MKGLGDIRGSSVRGLYKFINDLFMFLSPPQRGVTSGEVQRFGNFIKPRYSKTAISNSSQKLPNVFWLLELGFALWPLYGPGNGVFSFFQFISQVGNLEWANLDFPFRNSTA